MKTIRLVICFGLLTALLLLLSCDMLNRPKRPDRAGRASAEQQAGEAAGAGAESAADDAGNTADNGKSGDSTGQDADTASDDDAAAGGETDAAAGADDEASETKQDDVADDSAEQPETPQAAELDLSGDWLALYSRDASGVRNDLWDTKDRYRFSGNRHQITISLAGGGGGLEFDSMLNVPIDDPIITQDGRFMVVEVKGRSRTAYMRMESAGSLAAGTKVHGQLAGQQLAGSLQLDDEQLTMQFDNGMNFKGKAREGSYFGYLDGGRPRGYCALFVNSAGALEGILFMDPYKDFVTGVSFEVVP